LSGILIRIAPIIFVVLWSTGYIAAKYAVPEAEPMAFLTWRYALVVVILLPLVLFWRLPWPSRPLNYLHLCITGVCCHCIGLGGVFLAIDRQVEAGVSALIMALQPVLAAAVAAVFLRERLSARQLLGLTLGFAGVALVVSDRLSSGAGTMTGVAWNLLGVVAFTVGTFYQKVRNQHANPFIGAVVQFAAAAAACFLLSLLLGGNGIRWVPQVIGALAWSVLVLSITATMVLYWLIRRGAMAEVSSLFYLVPVSAALLAWPLFGEQLTIIAFGGMLVTVAGVALVTRPVARAS
jgi:drug/metabolite transporter (DMT)-like permease